MLTELSRRPKADQRDFSNPGGFRVTGDPALEPGLPGWRRRRVRGVTGYNSPE